MNNPAIFRLKVTRLDRNCLFELSWGMGQQLSAHLNYPESITGLYADWQRAYLSFYQQLPNKQKAVESDSPSSLHSDLSVFTGSQYHAYAIHHLLTQRLVVPIPDWCMIVVAVLLGKGTVIIFKQQCQKKSWTIALVSLTIIYGLASWQIYISGAVLLPWLLPSIAFLICAIPVFSRRNSYG